MKTLKQQVNDMLHSKIKRIAQREYAKANPYPQKRKHKPYTLPVEVKEMTEMLGRIESASDDELNEMAAYATSGAVNYLVLG